MKRILSVLLIAVMLIGAVAVAPLCVSAASYVTVAKEKTYAIENGKSVLYRIPRINLSGSDAAAVNKEITDRYLPEFDRADNNAAKGVRYSDAYAKEINFYTYVNGSILSVVIKNAAPYNQYISYNVYNFNVKTGKRLYNSDILAQKGASLTSVKKNIIALLNNEYAVVFKNAANNPSTLDMAKKQQARATSDSALNESLFYLGSNGKLMAKYTYYSIAGSGTYYRLSALTAYAAKPTVTKFENVNAGVKLTWGKVSEAAKYRVFAKTASGWKKVTDTASVSYIYRTTASGKKYTFTVRAMDNYGNFISSYNKTGFSYTFLAAPQITSLTNTSNGIKIRWNAVKGAKTYRLFVKSGTSGWKKVCDTTGTGWTNGKVVNGTRYTYTVRCVTASGKSYVSGFNATGASIICKR